MNIIHHASQAHIYSRPKIVYDQEFFLFPGYDRKDNGRHVA